MVQYFQVRKIVHETVTTLCRTGQNCISLSLQAMCINFCGVTLVQCVCSCKSQKLYYYRRGTPGWHSTGSHSHLSTWTGSSLLLSGSSGDHLQCRLPPVQLCVQKQKVISDSLQIGINCHYQILMHVTDIIFLQWYCHFHLCKITVKNLFLSHAV